MNMTASQKAKKTFLNGCIQHIRDTYSFLKGKKVYIYGSGELGTFLCKVLVAYGCVCKKDIKAFIDNVENRSNIYGIPVLSLDECDFRGDNDYCVVVGLLEAEGALKELKRRQLNFFIDTRSGLLNVSGPMLWAFSEIPEKMSPSNMLAKIGRFHELCLPLQEMEGFYEDEQSLAVLHNRIELYQTGQFGLLDSICPVETQEYFGPGLPEIGEHEVYVDCGAFTGDTVQAFIAAAKGKYDRIVAFEPDAENFSIMERNLAELRNVDLVKAATGNCSGEVLFSDGHEMVSAIDLENGSKKCRIIRLDDYFNDPVTFVKMDIEGAELDTLHGMTRIMQKYHPKLAICAYHKVEDLYTLPKFIKSVVPEYHLKLRQHRPCLYGTVLYAEV